MHAYIFCSHFGFKTFLGSCVCIGSRASIGSSRRSLMCHFRHCDRLSVPVVVIYVAAVLLAMSKRKSIGEEQRALSDGGRKHLRAQLCATTTSSKTALAYTLHTLQQEGVLKDGLLGTSVGHERRCMSEAVAEHSKAETPYARIVQRVDIGDGEMWDLIHPFARIYYLTSKSDQFSEFFNEVANRAG